MVVLNKMAKYLSVALLLFIVSMTHAASTAYSSSQGAPVRVIEITAQRFDFWPPEIRVVEGEQVELRIQSEDTSHGFRIAGTGVNLTVPKRGKGEARAMLTAGAPGRYTIECTRICGAGHNFMRAALIVAPKKSEGATQ